MKGKSLAKEKTRAILIEKQVFSLANERTTQKEEKEKKQKNTKKVNI